MGKAAKLVQNAGVVDAKNESDTLKLWENYREQATLWRAIALLQIPATIIVSLVALYLANTREVTLNVPSKPLPGIYTVQQIPDSEFIDYTTEFINLIATYQPAVARRQFVAAMNMLKEPMLTRFRDEMIGEELKAIETTNRVQLFFVDPLKTRIDRRGAGKQVIVTVVGDRMKMISGKEVPSVKTRFVVTMTTVPHNQFNKYGIVITNVLAENLEHKQFRKEYKHEIRDGKKKKNK
jgi:hypothetical protein